MSAWHDGSPDAKLMVIYDGPTEEDLRNEKPLSDSGAKIFWRFLANAGVDRADCYIVGTTRGRVLDPNDGPTDEQYADSWDEFNALVGGFRGRVAVSLGSHAFHRATGLHGSHEEWSGYLIRADQRGQLVRRRTVEDVYKTANKAKGRKVGDLRLRRVIEQVRPVVPEGLEWHLTTQAHWQVQHSGFSTAPLLKAHCIKLGKLVHGTLPPSRVDFTEVAETDDAKTFAIDMEGWTSIDRIGLATKDLAWSVPWDAQAREACRHYLENPECLAILHNESYDRPLIEAAGIEFKCKRRDTMLMAALASPDAKKGLNSCGSTYLACERWKPPRSAEGRSPKPTYSERLDEQSAAAYNALDNIRTLELHDVLEAHLQSTGQLALFDDVIMPAMPVLMRMKKRGILLDREAQNQWVEELSMDFGAKLLQWERLHGRVSPTSPPQLKAHLKGLGIKLPSNKKGKDTTDKEGLMKLKAKYPEHEAMFDLLLQIRDVKKALGTYAGIEPGSDGRVHASFTPISKDEDGLGKELAGTWRITAKQPNLQNQTPKSRRMYVPSPGFEFVYADYGSLEARLLAAFSGDSVLAEAIEQDLHDFNMKRLGVTRTLAKGGFYGWSYMAGARTVYNSFEAKGFKVPMKDCENLLAGFERMFEKASSWRWKLVQQCEQLRYVQNPFGLRRYFPEKDFPVTRVVNTYIQSSGALMIWHILREVEDAMVSFGGAPLVTVHDSFLCEVPLGKGQEAAKALKHIMEKRFDQIAPGFFCPVKPEVSAISWGEL